MLAQLHKRVGDTVIGSFGSPNTGRLYIAPFKLLIMGPATLPAIGGGNFADHPRCDPERCFRTSSVVRS